MQNPTFKLQREQDILFSDNNLQNLKVCRESD
jgi:hypothetical protein